MSTSRHVDAVVIGSGEGGKYLAWHLARSGARTVVVERRWVGGACPNIACLPSKNEIRSAEVAHLARGAAAFGVRTGPVTVDMRQVRARKREMVDGLVAMHLDLFASSGAELVMGHATLAPDRTVQVALNRGGDLLLTADRLFLDLGSRASIPDIEGLDAAGPLTHIEALELDRVPDHLLVLGGGYVGLELAQAFRRFGAAVTILEHGPRLASREDPAIADALLDLLRDEGITVHLGATARRIAGRSGDNLTLHADTQTGPLTLAGTDLLVATGRTPNTDGIGLEAAGIALDARGFIIVNDRLETTASNVWAIGDAAGSPQFTHVSFDDHRVIRDNLAGRPRTTTDRLVPYAMFPDPPLARVGLDEAGAARAGLPVRTASLPVASVLRARTLSAARGVMNIVAAAESDRILGFTMLGPDAPEVMAVVQTAMLAGLPCTALRDAILAHPTMSEALGALLTRLPPLAA